MPQEPQDYDMTGTLASSPAVPEKKAKQGLFSKLGGASGIIDLIGRISAAVGAAKGNRAGAEAYRYRDEQKRQQGIDAQTAADNALRRQVMEQQISAFELPEQASKRKLAEFESQEKTRQKYAKPVPPVTETFGDQRKQYNPETNTWEPTQENVQVPGIPSPPLMGAPAGAGPRLVRKPIITPPKPDMSTTELDLQTRAQGGDKAARATLDRMQQDRIRVALASRPPAQGIPGSGRPLFDKTTGRYLGDYFAEGRRFVPAPTDIPGVPSEVLATRPLTETGERLRSDAATALVLMDDVEGASRGEHAAEAVPFAIGARSLRAAKDDVMDILRRLRTGAAINAAEEGFYRDQIPGVLDSEEDRAYKAGILRQLFTSLSTGQPKPDLAKFRKAGIGTRSGGQAGVNVPPPPDNSGNWKLQRNTKTGATRWVPK